MPVAAAPKILLFAAFVRRARDPRMHIHTPPYRLNMYSAGCVSRSGMAAAAIFTFSSATGVLYPFVVFSATPVAFFSFFLFLFSSFFPRSSTMYAPRPGIMGKGPPGGPIMPMKVYVRGLNFETNEETIRRVFGKFGRVENGTLSFIWRGAVRNVCSPIF